MKKQAYSIKLETRDESKYFQVQEFVKQIAKSEGTGETSNLDLCYFLNDKGRARVKFDRYFLPMPKKVIELTSILDSETINNIISLLYN